MKYEVTAEVKTTVNAETAHGAMEFVRQKYGEENIQSVAAVEKENETRNFLESTVDYLLEAHRDFISRVGVSFVTFRYNEVEVQIPAEAFFKAFSSYKVEDSSKGYKHLSVRLGNESSVPVVFEAFVTEKELDEHF